MRAIQAQSSCFLEFDFHKLGLGKKVSANKITFPFAIVDFWVTLAIELQCSSLKLLRGFCVISNVSRVVLIRQSRQSFRQKFQGYR